MDDDSEQDEDVGLAVSCLLPVGDNIVVAGNNQIKRFAQAGFSLVGTFAGFAAETLDITHLEKDEVGNIFVCGRGTAATSRASMSWSIRRSRTTSNRLSAIAR